MDDLDLEKLKHELDGVYGSSRYNVDEILHEAGVEKQDSDGTDLEQLMKQLGVSVDSGSEVQMHVEEESDDLSALLFAVEQTQELEKQQEDVSEQDGTQNEPEMPSLLDEQKNAFADLFEQVSEIEQHEAEDEDVLGKPEQTVEGFEAETEPLTVDEIPGEQAETEVISEQAEQQPEPEISQKPKKGFFAKLFGISDVEYDMPQEAEPVGLEPEPELPDERAVEQEETVDTPELEDEAAETQEPPRPVNAPLISEEELEEFLSSVSVETDIPRTSFEELLRDNGVDLEKPIKPVKKQISLNEFPEQETTLYVDIPVREKPAQKTGQAELFDVDTALEADEAEKETPIEPLEPDWLHMSLEELCSQAPPLGELRKEGPVMAREVARQKEWLLDRRRAYLKTLRGKKNTEETARQPQVEKQTEAIHAGDDLQAMLEQQSGDEERNAVFTDRSVDKPETEPADRENKLANAEHALEQTQEIIILSSEEQTAEAQPQPAQENIVPEPVKKKKKRNVWPKEDVPQDLRRASGNWRRRARKQGRRSVLIAVCTLIAIYVSCAADFSILPLPASMDYSANPANVLSVLLVLQAVSMLAAYDVILEGIQAVLHLTPNFSTLVDLALILNIVHCIVRIVSEGEEIPYVCIAMLALFAQMRAKFSFSCTRHYIFKAAANASQPIGIFYHDGKKPYISKSQVEDTSRFIEQVVQPDENWKQEQVLTILAVVISIVLSAMVCTATGDAGRLPHVLAATVTGACQVALLSASAMGHRNAVHHMVKNGAAVDGRRGARKLASANEIILTDEDLFPMGSVTLQEIELRSSLNDATALAYAAALAGNCSLGRMLAEEVRARYGSQLLAHHIVRYVGGGISGQAGGLEILLGGKEFMAERGIAVSDAPENGLVLAVDGSVAAIFVIGYSVPAALFNAVQVLTERHIAILLYTRSDQVTPQMVERLYGLRAGSIKLAQDESLSYTENDTLCGILIRDGLVPLSDCISTAQAQTRLSGVGMLIGIGAAITCMLLMMYLCYIFVPIDARPVRILIYTVLCFVPIFFLENGVGRN